MIILLFNQSSVYIMETKGEKMAVELRVPECALWWVGSWIEDNR